MRLSPGCTFSTSTTILLVLLYRKYSTYYEDTKKSATVNTPKKELLLPSACMPKLKNVVSLNCFICTCFVATPPDSCVVRITVLGLCVCVCVCVFPGRSSATHKTTRQSRHYLSTQYRGCSMAFFMAIRFEDVFRTYMYKHTAASQLYMSYFLYSFRILRL